MKKINKILLELYSDRYQLLIVSVVGLLSFIVDYYTFNSGGVYHASVGWVVAGTMVLNYLGQQDATAAASQSSAQANAIAAENMRMQNEITQKQLDFQKKQAAKLEIQKDVYRNFEFKNPYENVTNQFADNIYEDLTIDTRAVDFQTQQGQQQRANILQGLRGTAGSSGVAGLAQALANQGALQTQQISAGISQQERQNQQMERQGEMLKRQGASAAEMARLGGEASVQEMEMSRQATLLGIQMGQTSGANAAVQQAYANQMMAGANQANLYGQQAAAQWGLAGQYSQNMSDTMGNYLAYKAG
jgi:hypothetical protein